MKPKTQSREEFEEASTQKLKSVVVQTKQMRKRVRDLESEVGKKEEKIEDYENTFSEIEKELVKLQTMLYADGTT